MRRVGGREIVSKQEAKDLEKFAVVVLLQPRYNR